MVTSENPYCDNAVSPLINSLLMGGIGSNVIVVSHPNSEKLESSEIF